MVLSIENGHKFSAKKYTANDDFLNPLDALIPKITFSLLPNFGSGSPPGPGGPVSVRCWGPVN